MLPNVPNLRRFHGNLGAKRRRDQMIAEEAKALVASQIGQDEMINALFADFGPEHVHKDLLRSNRRGSEEF